MPSSRRPNRQSTQRPTRSQLNAASRRPPGPRTAAPPELVDPRWLLKALALVFAVALLCAWGTLWLLYYQGQWQIVLHPSRTVATTPASVGLKFTPLRFAVDTAGIPQLDGWLIPASGDTATPAAPTALFLHSADGSIDNALPKALILHNAGLNILLFDYRGYGRSTGKHPTQTSMQQDAEAALKYLISTRHIPPQDIVLYGDGIGASLAVQLAAQHPDVSSVILDAPDGDLLDRASRDARSRMVPARLLFNERFPLAEPLRTLATPKLLISYASSAPAALANAANPKTTVELPSPADPKLVPAIQRFIDLYVHAR
jgi:pimeloyl-ACP methyl ester carboxylesterase